MVNYPPLACAEVEASSPKTFFFLFNRLTIRFQPYLRSTQTNPGVPPGLVFALQLLSCGAILL